MKIDFVGKSDTGSKRERNEDAIVMFARDEVGIFLVADGMGGYTNGEIASGIIRQEIAGWWHQFSEEKYGYNFQRMMMALGQVIENANKMIFEGLNQGRICGSTVVLLFVYKEMYGIIHVGDSRCYLLQGRKLQQVTVDETWENQPGVSTEERNNLDHPNRGKLVNAVGIRPNLQCRMMTNQINPEMIFLLCSDGLYKMCPEKTLKDCLKQCRKERKMELMRDKLLDIVYQNGAKDNVSFIIVKCGKE